MEVYRLVFLVSVFAFTTLAAATDLRTRRLPNALTVPALALAVLYAAMMGWRESGLAGLGSGVLFALAGFATGFGILLVLWLIGGGGGGDVKFMGALGAWLGATLTLRVLFISTVLVTVGALAVLAWSVCRFGIRGARRRFLAAQKDAAGPKRKTGTSATRGDRMAARRLVPFAVPVAMATWSVLIFTELVPLIGIGS